MTYTLKHHADTHLAQQVEIEKVSGVVLDGEATMQAAARELEIMHPHMTNIMCQAHAISLLLKVRHCHEVFVLSRT
jgi:hypothetical protein